MIVGQNPILEALKSGRTVYEIIVVESKYQTIVGQLDALQIRKRPTIKRTNRKRIDELAKGNHQGVIAYVEPYQYATLEDLFQRAERAEELPFFVILDEIEDPHNLGSILRTADATGVHGIIIPKRRSVGLTAAVAKTSAGAIEYVPVVQVTNIVDVIEKLKARNVWVVGTSSQGSEDYRSLDGKTPIALVIGNEGKGIGRLVEEKCDWTVFLPMEGQVPSLNASVASSLLLYEVFRKRHPFGG